MCVYGLFYTCKTQLHINIDVIQLVTIVAYGEESSLKEKILGGYYNGWRVKNLGYSWVSSLFNYDFTCAPKCFAGMTFESFTFNPTTMATG